MIRVWHIPCTSGVGSRRAIGAAAITARVVSPLRAAVASLSLQKPTMADSDLVAGGSVLRSTAGAEPVVSTVIPAYRAADFVVRAVESALAQSWAGHEVIVVNDGSPDTAAMEQRLAPYRTRITYIRQENGGPAAARNTGVALARGEYVAFLDADDYWSPDFLREQLQFVRGDPGFDLAYTDGWLVGETTNGARKYMDMLPSTGNVTVRSLLLRRCTVLTSSVLVKRSTLLEVGPFDPQFRGTEDYDMWLRVAQHGARMGYQRKALITRDVHRDSLSGDSTALVISVLAVYRKLAAMPLARQDRAALETATRTTVAALSLARGKDALRRGNVVDATADLRSANAVYRRWKIDVALLGLELAPGLVQWVECARASADERHQRSSRGGRISADARAI